MPTPTPRATTEPRAGRGWPLLLAGLAPVTGAAPEPTARAGDDPAPLFALDGRAVRPDAYRLQQAQLDEDGLPDLLVSSPGGPTLLFGRGDGGFRPASPRYPGLVPGAAAAVELDGDGRADLVLGSGDGVLRLARGRGDGEFVEGTTLLGLPSPAALTAADLDGDGRADVAVNGGDLFAGPSMLQVFVSLGGGDYAAPGLYRTSFGSSALELADLDRDGDLDAAVFSGFFAKVSVLSNAGDATFSAPLDVAVGASVGDLAVTDLDLDGAPDLVTVSALERTASLRWGAGDGTFPDGDELDVDALVSDVEPGDLDGDGLPDLAFGDFADVFVFRGVGSRSFAGLERTAGALSGEALALVDLDLDGRLDACAANVTLDTAAVHGYLGRGDGSFRWAPGVAPAGFAGSLGIPVLVDLDGDGYEDLFAARQNEDAVLALLVAADGTVTERATAATEPSRPFAGDFDGDGVDDVGYVEASSFVLRILLGNGDGTFVDGPSAQLSDRPVEVRAVDADGDGVDDVVLLTGAVDTVVELYRSEGGAALTPWQAWPAPERLAELLVLDVDGDGDDDLVTGASGAARVRLYRNVGGGAFRAAGGFDARLDVAFYALQPGDVDGDGYVDLLITSTASTRLTAYYGTGDGRFERGPSTPLEDCARLSLADVDGDGRVDVLASAGGLRLLLGAEGRTFRPAGQYACEGSAYLTRDVDGDGDLDVLGAGGDELALLVSLVAR